MEKSIVRENLMTQQGYSPYCGNQHPTSKCSMPRTIWNKDKEQFVCPECNWESTFPTDFITRYKTKWNK